jgi:hypothetical protein
MPSWVVQERNGHESNHLYWGFAISFQNKPCLAPHLILSDHSMCISPHQGIRIACIHCTYNDGYMWSPR